MPRVSKSWSLVQRGSCTARTALFCGAGLVVLGACRFENPAFNKNAGGEDVGEQSTSLGPGPGPDGTGTEKGPDTVPEPDTTKSTAPGPESTQGPGTETGGGGDSMPQPDKAAEAFCEGAAICFPIHQLAPGGVVQDLGPGNLTINFDQPISLERNWADPPPLDHSIRMTPETPGMVSAPLVWTQQREVGFDIWFSPEDVNANHWTLFELDDLLAVERLRTGGLRCSVKSGLVDVGPVVVNPEFEPGKIYHVACGMVGDRLQMWWSSQPIAYGLPVSSGEQTSFAMRLGAGIQNERAPFSGRVASLRIWSSVEQMRIKNGFSE